MFCLKGGMGMSYFLAACLVYLLGFLGVMLFFRLSLFLLRQGHIYLAVLCLDLAVICLLAAHTWVR